MGKRFLINARVLPTSHEKNNIQEKLEISMVIVTA